LIDLGNDDLLAKLVTDPDPKYVAVPDGQDWLTIEKDGSVVIIDPTTGKPSI
jgi:hypothetical protein